MEKVNSAKKALRNNEHRVATQLARRKVQKLVAATAEALDVVKELQAEADGSRRWSRASGQSKSVCWSGAANERSRERGASL